MARLRAVKVIVSHPCIHKKLDEFGKVQESLVAEKLFDEGERLKDTHRNTDDKVALVVDMGRKVMFDNIDYKQNVHHMTEDHQSPMFHWVTYMSVEN
eukprot:Seg5754.2 transcript_id=Seg5754.2/GoldUCD/mRNA.D3Y31 product="hypothetical protein" pseudo=true protein_id=Seg5754.2/GoldUCD/D3Y31